MGVDFLDCLFRIEKEFGIRLREGYALEKLVGPPPRKKSPPTITAGDLNGMIEQHFRDHRLPVPGDCWPRVRACIAATINESPASVSPESRIVQDLGFT